MTCSFCGREFAEDRARKECRGCSLFGGCRNVKCPYCGYEMPQKPRLLEAFGIGREKKR